MKLVNVATNAEYALTPRENAPRNSLPKRYSGVLKLVVDGTPVEAPVTENKGWAGSAPTLSYPWFVKGDRAYYVTLGPGETLDGEYRIADGVASRKNPKRETTKVEVEKARIEKFVETWKANRAPKVDAAPLEAAMVEPVKVEPEKKLSKAERRAARMAK